jgi:hypothetical protein
MNSKKPSANAAKATKTPHVYSPLPVPKVLQRKQAMAQPKNENQSTRATPVSQQQRKAPTAPAVYRPQPVPSVLQNKPKPTAPAPRRNAPASIQRKTKAKPVAPKTSAPNSVIQRSEGTYISHKAKRNYTIDKQAGGGKFYLLVREVGSSTVLANMRYKFYSDGLAVMEHVEAYGMPPGTRAGYLLFALFADHAAQAGIKQVGIGTGVDEKSVKRNLEQAELEKNQKGVEEARRNMAAVHIYKELGFDATDAMRLSNSTLTVQQVRLTARQKMSGSWQLRPNYRAMIQGFQQMIAEITAPLPVGDQMDRLTGHIGDNELDL